MTRLKLPKGRQFAGNQNQQDVRNAATKPNRKIKEETKTLPIAKPANPMEQKKKLSFLEQVKKSQTGQGRLNQTQGQKLNQPLIPIKPHKVLLARAATENASKPTTQEIVKGQMKKAEVSIRRPIQALLPNIPENPSRPKNPADSTATTGLIDSSIKYDESQLAAIEKVSQEMYSCLIGAAGTGKTTVLKAVIHRLYSSTRAIDVSSYWKSALDANGNRIKDKEFLPAICLCAFTGQAVQMVKHNMPKSWHANTMTIHRMLGYYPEYYTELSDRGVMENKMRFVPAYNETNKLPWDIIIIDEAGMCSVDLWENIFKATTAKTRIILVGDINQLPPVHGKPILAYGMINWPVAALEKIHRQKGKENPIVENAWKILQGKSPEIYPTFSMFEMPANPNLAQTFMRKVYKALRNKKVNGEALLDPDSDIVITPMNGDKPSDGAPLGQIPLNDIISTVDLKGYKKDHDRRFLINAGRDQKLFAVGDRVMATKNDHEIGLTNGMMGEIVSIKENGNYTGTREGYGVLNLGANELGQDYLAAKEAEEKMDNYKINIETLIQDTEGNIEKSGETLDALKGKASHIVTVRFGPKFGDKDTPAPERHDENKDLHGMYISFESFSEVGSLMLCYAITCHKAQGAEFNTVVIVLHSTHCRMLYKEWLYTAITRAKKRVVLLYTKKALASALSHQRIPGTNLKEKIRAFSLLAEINPDKKPSLQTPRKVHERNLSNDSTS